MAYRVLKILLTTGFAAASFYVATLATTVLVTRTYSRMGFAAMAVLMVLLSLGLLWLFYLAWRNAMVAVDGKMAPARPPAAPARAPVFKTPRRTGLAERLALAALLCLGAAAAASGFRQYAALERAAELMGVIRAHTAVGLVAVAAVVAYLAALSRRYCSWGVTAFAALYPVIFILMMLVPSPMLLSMTVVNGIFLPGMIIWLALQQTPPERRAAVAAAALALFGFTYPLMIGVFSIMHTQQMRFAFNTRIIHAVLSPCAVIAPLVYAILRRRARRGGAFGRREVALVAVSLALGAALGAGLHARKNRALDRLAERHFYPSPALAEKSGTPFRTAPAGSLGGDRECGTCHEITYEQWARGTHAYAARTITFQKVAKALMQKHGDELGRLCAACHDPEVALGGDPRRLVDPRHVKRSQGVGCRECHYMTEAHNKNALYGFSLPRADWLFDTPAARRDYILTSVLEHVNDVTHPVTKNGRVCFPCHSLESLRKGKVQIPVDNVSSFAASEFNRVMPCHRCHMPRVKSVCYSWMDHRFFGSQEELPLVAVAPTPGERRALEAFSRDTRRWLDGRLNVLNPFEAVHDETFKSFRFFNYARGYRAITRTISVATGGNHFDIRLERAARRAGGLELVFSVVNRNVSHDFPSALFANITDVWFELRVSDASGKTIFFSGFDRDDLTHRLGRIEVDAGGHPIFPTDSMIYEDIIHKKFLKPEKKYEDAYTVPLPTGVRFPLTARYRLMYRRYNAEFIRWASNGKISSAPQRTIARKTFTIDDPSLRTK